MSAHQGISFETRVKAAAAICVAGRIFAETRRRAPSSNKLLRSQLAGDVLDKTMPRVAIAQRYPAKPDEQSDLDFLLHNLDEVSIVDPDAWLPRRVPMADWAEYTRAIRGLETFLKRAFTDVKLNKLEAADIQGMLIFIAADILRIPDLKIRQALTQGTAVCA